jgi:hypothetical protein
MSVSAAATTFNFQFDLASIYDGNTSEPVEAETPPLVGTGVFVAAENLSPGTYQLASLAGYSVSFTFDNGATFSTADIATPSARPSVEIYGSAPGAEILLFSSIVFGSEGPGEGSLDLVGSAGYLSFAPSWLGTNQYFYQRPDGLQYQGSYRAISAPEPASWIMLTAGFGMIGSALRRRQRAKLDQRRAREPRIPMH